MYNKPIEILEKYFGYKSFRIWSRRYNKFYFE